VTRAGVTAAGGSQHGNVEMILQRVARFDRLLVAAVDEENAFAVEAHEGHGGSFLRGCRNERRHLGSGGCRVFRPAGGFANVDESNAAIPLFDHLREQRRLLDAADQQRALSRRSGLTASGTGTDCIAVLAPVSAEPERYAGSDGTASCPTSR
jgi:hypothetical protein